MNPKSSPNGSSFVVGDYVQLVDALSTGLARGVVETYWYYRKNGLNGILLTLLFAGMMGVVVWLLVTSLPPVPDIREIAQYCFAWINTSLTSFAAETGISTQSKDIAMGIILAGFVTSLVGFVVLAVSTVLFVVGVALYKLFID